ncbi:MAG: toxin-antitoxin system HicB family antitoxin [Solirubrobacteraceae bacterium]|nr:toxin-antitoxin system HicB family antitoxin [Solirubrobacteraceae bacterium]
MRQLLLRVPDELHARLAARAAREGRSVNQLATQILDAAVDADRGDRSARLRARAAAQGVLVPTTGAPVSAAVRRRALEGMSGLGPVVDELIDDDRERR